MSLYKNPDERRQLTMNKSKKWSFLVAGLVAIGTVLSSSDAMAAKTVTTKECNDGGGIVIIPGNQRGGSYCSGGKHDGIDVQGLRSGNKPPAGKKPPIGKGGDTDEPGGGKPGSPRPR